MSDFSPAAAGSPLFLEWLNLVGAVADSKPPAIGPDDALVVIDMQRDFVPADPLGNPNGGRFGVAEGDHVVPVCVHLIDAAAAAGATIAATRDYHPVDHASFMPQGGPFPPHCMQGTVGARFMPQIAAALARAISDGGTERVKIAFKAFHEAVDSFGGFPYYDGGEGRITKTGPSATAEKYVMGCTKAPWSGAVLLKQSALIAAMNGSGDDVDVDAPPDALATYEDAIDRGIQPMQEAIRKKKRIFVCGLALDFCVLDTAINAVAAGFEQVFVVLDAARAAHIPGIGTFGTGFLQDPKEVMEKMKAAGIKITNTVSVAANFQDKAYWEVAKENKLAFPASLGPISIAPAKKLKIKLDKGARKYSVDLDGSLAVLKKMSFSSNQGKCSPLAACPSHWPGAPPKCTSVAWAYPMEGMAQLERRSRLAFLAMTSSNELCFAAFGGFLLLDSRGDVIGVQAIVQGESYPDQLVFGEPRSWRKEFTQTLSNDGRFQPVTLPTLLRAGAKEFCWINPGEELVAGTERWTPSEYGAFLYLMGGNSGEGTHPHTYYPMGDPSAHSSNKSGVDVAGTMPASLAPSTNTYYRENKNSMESALSEAVHAAISSKAAQPVRYMGKTLLEIADRTQ